MLRRGGWIRAGISTASFMPVAIILGLVMIPADCHCGAAHPHPHSIFTLPNHTHIEQIQAPQPGDAHGAPVDQHSYTVTARTPSAPGWTAALLSTAGPVERLDVSSERVSAGDGAGPVGLAPSPDPPPPR